MSFIQGERETKSKSAENSPTSPRRTERFLSVVNPPRTRKMSNKDENIKFREHNQFDRKVPKNAETVNIQV